MAVNNQSQTTRTRVESAQERKSYPFVSLLGSGSPQYGDAVTSASDRRVSSGAVDLSVV